MNRKNIRYIIFVLFYPLWLLQLLIPRKKNIWIFGAWNGDRYSDNSKYLYEYVLKNHPEIRAIWITKNKSLFSRIAGEAYLLHSLKSVYYTAIAGHVFVTSGKKDINSLFTNGAKMVHLWHGNPIKKIGLDDSYSPANSFTYSKIVKNFFPAYYEFNYDYVIANSDYFAKIFSSAFGVTSEQILTTGCPRNDTFFSKTPSAFNSSLRKKFGDSKIVYYLPTFRSHKNVSSLFNLPSYDSEKVNAFLKEKNLVLVNKGHYVDNKLTNNNTAERIINLSDNDIQEDICFILKDADALITDYSGTYFDYLLTERPIIFAAFDLKEYLNSSREIYEEYEDVIGGPIARDWNEILECLTTIWDDESYKKLIREQNKKFNKFHDSNNSKRVAELIKSL